MGVPERVPAPAAGAVAPGSAPRALRRGAPGGARGVGGRPRGGRPGAGAGAARRRAGDGARPAPARPRREQDLPGTRPLVCLLSGLHLLVSLFPARFVTLGCLCEHR